MKSATVKVALLPFGRAYLRYVEERDKAIARGDLCQQLKITDRSGQYVVGGDRCDCIAKMLVEGKPVCARHAAMLMLQAALKASR